MGELRSATQARVAGHNPTTVRSWIAAIFSIAIRFWILWCMHVLTSERAVEELTMVAHFYTPTCCQNSQLMAMSLLWITLPQKVTQPYAVHSSYGD